MRHTQKRVLNTPWNLAPLILTASISTAIGQTVYVAGFGDGNLGLDGWKSDDTRSSAGTNLIGSNFTHAGAGSAVAGHDELIATQLDWVTDFLGTRGNLGGLRFDGTSAGSGKSTISVIDPVSSNGLASASLLDDPGFGVFYRWRKEDNLAAAGLSVKIGIQSTSWGVAAGQSQLGFTPLRSGETIWDLVLVYDPTNNYPTGSSSYLQGASYNHLITANSGRWFLYDQAGNSYFDTNVAPIPGNSNPPNTGQTLSQWLSDPTWGALLSGGKITNTQFGVGSGNGNTLVSLDVAQVSYLNSGKLIDFVDAARWSGGATGDFLSPSNWNDNQAPTGTRNAVIDSGNGATSTLTLNPGVTANVRSLGVGSGSGILQLGSGASLIANNNGYLSAESGASLSISGGTVTAATIEAWGSVQLQNTTVALDGGSVNHPVRGGGYGIVVGPGGEFTIGNAANVTVNNNPSVGGVVRVGEGLGAAAVLKIEAGASLTIGTPARLGALQVGDFGSTGEVRQSGGLVEVIGSLNVGNRSAATGGSVGTYSLSGGTLRLSGGLYSLGRTVGSDAFAAQGQFNLGGGLLEVVDGSFVIGDRDSTGLQGSGVLTQTGGILRVGANGGLYLAGYGGGTYNLSGGSLEIGGTSLFTNYNNSAPYSFKLGGGTIKVTGANLTTNAEIKTQPGTESTVDTGSLNATFQGAVTGGGSLAKAGTGTLTLAQEATLDGLSVQAGTVVAQGIVNASGNVHVAAGATLEGTGAGQLVLDSTGILSGGGLVNLPVTVLGTVAAGSSVGQLTLGADFTFASGSTFAWELGGNTTAQPGVNFDLLTISGGAFTISTGVTLNLSFGAGVNFGDAFWDSPQNWTIIDGAGAASFNYAALDLINGSNAAGQFAVSGSGSGVSLNWQPVPEPSGAMLLGCATVGLIGLRRHRR